jgi:hypothetical protein
VKRLLLNPTALIALLLLGGCAPPPPPPPLPGPAALPDTSGVERAVFLLGDAGDARAETSPVLARLRADVEGWSARLPHDSAVAVLVLGDNVYPTGLHAPDEPPFARDTAVLMDQVRLVGGPQARAHAADEYFVAGNHDWGLKAATLGLERLRRQEAFLDLARLRTGARVRLVPEAGTGGPFVLDWGTHARFLLLDTAWWLVASNAGERKSVLAGIDSAMAAADGQAVFLVSHHPFKSAGSHGGNFSFWRTLGAQYLLSRSGALVQNLNSAPYEELEQGLISIFARRGPPLASLAGHEHTLQVIEATEPTVPRFMLISGSGSKNSRLGTAPGLRLGLTAPGYMRLLLERDGGVVLTVEAAPPEFLACPAAEPERGRCMSDGVAAFRTVYARRLR